MFYRSKKKFPSQKPIPKKEEKTEQVEGELTEEQNKKLIEQQNFEKLSPEEQKEVLSKRVATKKVRCKNWPNCTDPTCTYSHPTETVSKLN